MKIIGQDTPQCIRDFELDWEKIDRYHNFFKTPSDIEFEVTFIYNNKERDPE
jgi:hypothetical protein